MPVASQPSRTCIDCLATRLRSHCAGIDQPAQYFGAVPRALRADRLPGTQLLDDACERETAQRQREPSPLRQRDAEEQIRPRKLDHAALLRIEHETQHM